MAETSIAVYGGMFDSTEVTETVGGFPKGNKAVDSEFFAKMISCFYKDGVLGDDSFAVTPGEGLKITVAPGVAWAKGRMAWLKSAVSFNVSSGKSYSVMLRLNLAAGEFNIILSDSVSYVPQNDSNYRDLVFATVNVPSGASSVSISNITDRRSDVSYCGVVTSALDVFSSVENAQNASSLGGVAASEYVKKSGGTMTGTLTAKNDATGACVVRNIGYGTSLPSSLENGELFILIES